MANHKERLINANLAADQMRDPERQRWQNKKIPKNAVDWAIHILDSAPAVKAAPVVHAKWEFEELDNLEIPVRCTNCGFGEKNVDPIGWLKNPGHRFCGACGAKMNLSASRKPLGKTKRNSVPKMAKNGRSVAEKIAKRKIEKEKKREEKRKRKER